MTSAEMMGPTPDQEQCIETFNRAPGTITMPLQTVLTVVTGKDLQNALFGSKVAVGRVTDLHAHCLVTVTFPFYGRFDSSQREERFTQFEYPADWSPKLDQYGSQFKDLGQLSTDPRTPGFLVTEMPDSVRSELNPQLVLMVAPPSSERRNYGGEQNPPIDIKFCAEGC